MKVYASAMVAAWLLTSSGCANEMDAAASVKPQPDTAEQGLAGAGAPAEEGEVGVTSQALWESWRNPRAESVVGISRHPNSLVAHIWYRDGLMCTGGWATFCNTPLTPYSAASDPGTVTAVGFAVDTAAVYAWYLDGTVSKGNPFNFTSHNGKLSFTRPINPDTGVRFFMHDLLDADNSSNGQWYYYWMSHSHRVFRTTGTSRNAAAYSGPQLVTIDTGKLPILGISFQRRLDPPSPIQTWYASGHMNSSTTSLNLAQR